MEQLKQSLLHELLNYDPVTGVLTWKHRSINHFNSERIYKSWNTQFADKKAGYKYIAKTGGEYLALYIFYKRYQYQRVVWVYCNSCIDTNLEIDHINGNGLDNRIENLRAVSRQENSKNCKAVKNSKVGITGINLTNNGGYRVRIGVNYKSIYIGYYKDLKEAIEARDAAYKKYGYHANHGRGSQC